MKVLQKRVFLLCSMLFCAFAAFAQNNPQSVFNSAVDQVNCETIRFVHREAGRAEIANNMQCFSFESILKSIPEDEAGTTAKVAKDIEGFKAKFKADGDLSAQLDEVIGYASRKIEAKPRKGNVADFKTKLQTYKTDALENINAGANASGPTGGDVADNNSATSETGIDEAVTDDEETVVTTTETTTKSTDWLGWLSLLLALASLGLSGYLYNRLRNLGSAGSFSAPLEPEGNRSKGPNANEAMANYQLLESKMYQEIARLNKEVDEKIAAVTASTGYTRPENFNETASADSAEEEGEDDPNDDENDFLPTPVDQADAPIITSVQQFEVPQYISSLPDIPISSVLENEEEEEKADEAVEEVKQEEDQKPASVQNDIFSPAANAPVQNNIVEENTGTDETDDNTDTEIEQQRDIIAEYEPAEEYEKEEDFEAEEPEITAPPMRSDASSAIIQPQAPIIDEEDDGVALPDYKYAGLPMQDGSFAPDSFIESADENSLYEVEMYEDVPNKAFFSPLQYPETIEKMLSDPEKYLAPCCMLLNDAEGKQSISVIEEGRLRKQGDRWYIYEKARVRFD